MQGRWFRLWSNRYDVMVSLVLMLTFMVGGGRGDARVGWSKQQSRRVDQLRNALRPGVLAGYSVHPYSARGVAVDVIAARK